MSVVSDLRTALEDTISPTLRELKVKMDALTATAERHEKRLDRLETAMTEGFADIRRQLDTADRVRALELQMASLQEKREPAA